MTKRVPDKILARTIDFNREDLTPRQVKKIEAIGTEMKENGKIRLIEDKGPDVEEWNSFLQPYVDEKANWWDVPWFVWETYVYRRIIEAVDFWETGLDVFAAEKHEGLMTTLPSIQKRTELSCTVTTRWDFESFEAVLSSDLWGNQADASLFTLDKMGSLGGLNKDKLISDGSRDTWEILNRPPKKEDSRRVVFFNDNTGLEIVSDLCLAHYLLTSDQVAVVEMKVKRFPFFVSDATPADIGKTLDFLRTIDDPKSQKVGDDLASMIKKGRFIVTPEPFMTTGRPMWEMPETLRDDLKQNADLVIVKGDLMYRKLFGDYKFPTTAPFQQLTSYFPCPMVSLRTCKSPLAVGLAEGQEQQLEAADPTWMTDGQYGMIQLVDPAPVSTVRSSAPLSLGPDWNAKGRAEYVVKLAS